MSPSPKLRLDKLVLISASVDSLPPEVLGAVFDHGIEPYALPNRAVVNQRREWLSRICLVSKHWMDVAYSRPSLWTLINVNYIHILSPTGSEGSYESCRLHLERAKALPLDVILNITATRLPTQLGRPGFWRLWEEVKERKDRWRSIIIGKFPVHTEQELQLVLPTSLPNLAEAQLSCYSRVTIPSILAPQLQNLHLTPGTINTFIPFAPSTNLKKLHFLGALRDLHLLLQQAPNLHILSLDKSFFLPGDVPRDVELPCLRQFYGKGMVPSVATFLARLTAPKLELMSLIAVSPSSQSFDNVPSFHFPSLTSIVYESHLYPYLGPLRALLARYTQPGRLTIKLSPNSLSNVNDSFEGLEEDIRWIEARVTKVVWMGDEHESVTSSKIWQEARARCLNQGKQRLSSIDPY